jgi:hypothetical protein
MTHLSPNASDRVSPAPHRTARALVGMWLLIGLGAVVIWQLGRTAGEPMPDIPTPQARSEPALAPAVTLVTSAPPTPTPEDTPRPRRRRTPEPLAGTCAIWTELGEYCTNPYAPPTPTPPMRCDDPRLIGGQICVWPSPTPALGRLWQ